MIRTYRKSKINRINRTVYKAYAVIFALAIIVILGCSMFKTTEARQHRKEYKCFKSIVIKENDTLYNIAEKYNCKEIQSDRDYIKYVMELNHQLKPAELKKGMSIVVPYYIHREDKMI